MLGSAESGKCVRCDVITGSKMRAVGSQRGARTIGLALAAGLVTFEAVLALAAGAVGIPGLVLIRFAEENGAGQSAPRGGIVIAAPGGETVMAKLSQSEGVKDAERTAAAAPEAAKPQQPAGEQRLQGLETIPQNMDWDREETADEADRTKAFGETAQQPEELPWDAVEPVKFASLDSPSASKPAQPAAAPAQAARPPVQPLSSGDVGKWLKAKATEFKGEDRTRPLFHFELWLELPAELKQRLVAVAYDFSTPAMQPQSQISREQKTGFRVSAGGLACADKITLTLRFDDGHSQQVAVDGCALLG
jgi:hypothetical protein